MRQNWMVYKIAYQPEIQGIYLFITMYWYFSFSQPHLLPVSHMNLNKMKSVTQAISYKCRGTFIDEEMVWHVTVS